jgi:hypothetical protein
VAENVIVIDGEGNTIHSLSVGQLQPDTTLLGGFLSALQDFSDMFSGNKVQEMEMGNYHFLVSSIGNHRLITVHAEEREDSRDIHGRFFSLCQRNKGSIEDQSFRGQLERLLSSLNE